jgi:hypothetical protein
MTCLSETLSRELETGKPATVAKGTALAVGASVQPTIGCPARITMEVSVAQTTTMRSKLFRYVIRQLSRVLEQPWRSLLSLLGFALRFAIAFPVCLWLFPFLDFVQHCALFAPNESVIGRVLGCPLMALLFTTGEYFDVVYNYSLVLPRVLFIALCALMIAVAWGVVCRGRRAAAGPLPRTVRTALKQVTAGLTTMVGDFIGRFAVVTPICWCIYAWVVTEFGCQQGLSELCRASGVMAPLLLLSGPIAFEGEDPPNYHETALLLAMMVAVVWTLLALARKCLRTTPAPQPS